MATKPVPLMALDLFLAGNDTTDIARILRIDEHEAYNRVSHEREWRRKREARRDKGIVWREHPGLSDDGKILYAGAE